MADGDARDRQVPLQEAEGRAPFAADAARVGGRLQDILVEVQDGEVELLRIDVGPACEAGVGGQRALAEVPPAAAAFAEVADEGKFGAELEKLVLVRHVPAVGEHAQRARQGRGGAGKSQSLRHGDGAVVEPVAVCRGRRLAQAGLAQRRFLRCSVRDIGDPVAGDAAAAQVEQAGLAFGIRFEAGEQRRLAGLRRDGVAGADEAQRAVGGLRQEEGPHPGIVEGALAGQ